MNTVKNALNYNDSNLAKAWSPTTLTGNEVCSNTFVDRLENKAQRSILELKKLARKCRCCANDGIIVNAIYKTNMHQTMIELRCSIKIERNKSIRNIRLINGSCLYKMHFETVKTQYRHALNDNFPNSKTFGKILESQMGE